MVIDSSQQHVASKKEVNMVSEDKDAQSVPGDDEPEYEMWFEVPASKFSEFIRGLRDILGPQAIAEGNWDTRNPRAKKMKH
jgi:hypothetical protein